MPKLNKISKNFTLNGNNKQLYNRNMNTLINQGEQWVYEYKNCKKANIVVETCPHFTNVLCNATGDNSYHTILELQNYIEDEDRFEFELEDVLYEENGWWFYYNEFDYSNRIYLKPNQMDLMLRDKWDIALTVFSHYDNNLNFYENKPIRFGIPIINSEIIEYQNKICTLIYTSFNHNLNDFDRIKLTNNEIYQIYKIGDRDGENLNTTFILEGSIESVTNFFLKKINSNTGKTYSYTSKFVKKITNISQSNFDVLGYSVSYFNDRNFSTVFENVNVYGNDNIQVMYIKKKLNDMTAVQSCINAKDASVAFDNSYTNTNKVSIENDIHFFNEYYFEGIYEYNENNDYVKIVDVTHRFNTINREETGYTEGYLYKPFRMAYNLPSDYEYPFYNGFYEVYVKNNIYLRRQNPCGFYESELGGLIDGYCQDKIQLKFKITDKIC